MATKIDAIKADMYVEDVAFKNSVSQQLLSKFGQNIQHINEKQLMHWDFKYLGRVRSIENGGEDGVATIPFDFEIAAISFSFLNSGNALTVFSTIDIHAIDSTGTDVGSILGNKIQFSGGATGGYKGYYTNFVEGTNSGTASGIILPTFNNQTDRKHDAGTTLRIDLDYVNDDVYNLCVNIFYRPQ